MFLYVCKYLQYPGSFYRSLQLSFNDQNSNNLFLIPSYPNILIFVGRKKQKNYIQYFQYSWFHAKHQNLPNKFCKENKGWFRSNLQQPINWKDFERSWLSNFIQKIRGGILGIILAIFWAHKTLQSMPSTCVAIAL